MDKKHSILKKLRRKKVMTIDELSDALDCSTRNVQRMLKKWQGLRSCNKNGRYYTLPEIVDFNEFGLWQYEDKFFSKHGDLKQTILFLLASSSAGLTTKEIAAQTGINSNSSFLYQLRKRFGIESTKHFSLTVFFSQNKTESLAQRAKRQSMQMAKKLDCEDCLIILVELIKNPHIELIDLVLALKKMRSIRVSEESIRFFLFEHDLLKKTLDIKA